MIFKNPLAVLCDASPACGMNSTSVLLHRVEWAIKLNEFCYPCILRVVKISNFQIKHSVTDVIYFSSSS
jgi:hypothetical protein